MSFSLISKLKVECFDLVKNFPHLVFWSVFGLTLKNHVKKTWQ